MSACLTSSGKFWVCEWQMVTVQLAFNSIIAIGLPKIALRPTTTACLPASSTPFFSNKYIMPCGVQEPYAGSPIAILPNPRQVTPSTSFASAMASKQARSSIWLGTGCCSKIPCTSGLLLSSAIFTNSCSVVVACGMATFNESIPTR